MTKLKKIFIYILGNHIFYINFSAMRPEKCCNSISMP